MEHDLDVETFFLEIGLIDVESHDKLIEVPAEADGCKDPIGLPHGSEGRLGTDGTRSPPFKEVGDPAVDGGCEETDWLLNHLGIKRHPFRADRLVELVWRREAHVRPDIAEMRSEEAIEFGLEVGVEIVTVPPEPVTPFCGVQLTPGGLSTIRRKTRHTIQQLRASMPKQVPPTIVFLVSDPNFIIGIDPGT